MSNYTKITDFASKDALPSGNPSKVVSGTEIDAEFNAIATAVISKADTASPTFTGIPAAPTAAAGTNTTQLATTAHVFAERTNTATLTNKTLVTPYITQMGNRLSTTAGVDTGNSSMANASHTLGEILVLNNGTGAAMIAFARVGVFGAYLGLDTNNKLSYGGWSEGANAYQIYHQGNREIPAGTVMLFFQAAAPTGWTQVVTQNNKALRVVSGTGGGTGGSVAFSTVFGYTGTLPHTLSIAEIPSHTHPPLTPNYAIADIGAPGAGTVGYTLGNNMAAANSTGATGGGGAHTHNMDMRVQYIDVIICSKNT